MEIRVNDYIRTKDGYIGKVTRLGDEFSYDYIFESGDCKYAIGFQNIVKHSPNIIDLIEVGDYVNGKRVIYVEPIEDENDNEKLCVFVEETQDSIEEHEIKSIVTKEQFNSIKYVIGE